MASMSVEPEHVDQLVDMGFPAAHARRALQATHNCGVELALGWLVENQHADSVDAMEPHLPGERSSGLAGLGEPSCSGTAYGEPVRGQPPVLGQPVAVNPDGGQVACKYVGASDCKAVLVVDTSLKMSIGKTAAQCAHAAVGVFKGMHINAVPWLQAWEEEGERTVVLKASSSAELEELEAKAQTLLLPTFLVEDAGLTEVAPGSKTVLGIAGLSAVVDQVTGHLSILR